MSTFFRYRLAHQDSLLGVAYFSPEPVEPMSLEQCLDYIDTDELLEITPTSLRIRKKILDPTLRKRAMISRKNS